MVSTIKGTLFTRLKAKKGEGGYCHFPKDKSTGYDEVYFAGLLSERMTIKRSRGRDTVRWELRAEKTRNEPLDCRVYAIGAYEILNPDLRRYAAGIEKKQYNMDTPKTSTIKQKSASKRTPAGKRTLTFRRGFSL